MNYFPGHYNLAEDVACINYNPPKSKEGYHGFNFLSLGQLIGMFMLSNDAMCCFLSFALMSYYIVQFNSFFVHKFDS